MPIRVAGPAGEMFEFPDGTSPEVMQRALRDHFAKQAVEEIANRPIPMSRQEARAQEEQALSRDRQRLREKQEADEAADAPYRGFQGAPDLTPGGIIRNVAGAAINAVRNRAKSGEAERDAAKDEGFLDRAGSQLEAGTASAIGGLQRAATTISAPIADETKLEAARRDVRAFERAGNAEVAGDISDLRDVRDVGDVGSFIVGQGIRSLPEMGVTALPGIGLATEAVIQTGRIGQERAENNGRQDATMGDLAAAAPAAIGSAMLERAGIDRIIGAGGKTVARRVGQAAAGEALTEAGQSVLEYGGGTIATDAGFDPVEAAWQAAGGAVAGAGVGGAVRAGVEAVRISDRPVPAGEIETAATQAAELNDEDRASPLADDLIAQGKATIAASEATTKADTILAGAGLPQVQSRVTVDLGNGPVEGTIEDAFAGQDGAGVRIRLDDGTLFAEHFNDIADAGVTIRPARMTPAEADAEIDRMAADARNAADYAQENLVMPAPMESAQAEGVAGATIPAAPSSPAVSGGGAISGFMAKTRRVESGGSDSAKNPNSSATGRYQFTDGTWLATYRKVFGDTGESSAAILAKRGDGAMQDRLMGQLTQDNAASLRRGGHDVTEGNLYLAHFAGSGGANAILSADPNTPVETVLGQRAVDANPFLRGKTAGDVARWAAGKMGGSAAVVVSDDPGANAPAREVADPYEAALADYQARQMPEPDAPDTQLPSVDTPVDAPEAIAPEPSSREAIDADTPQQLAGGMTVDGVAGLVSDGPSVTSDKLRVIVRDASPEQVSLINAALPEETSLRARPDGSYSAPRKYEAAVQQAVASIAPVAAEADVRGGVQSPAQQVSATIPQEVAGDEGLGPVAHLSFERRGSPGIEVRNDEGHFATAVFRDDSGTPQAVVRMPISPEGAEIDSGVSSYVRPEFRRQGIATKLYDALRASGHDVDAISGSGDLTPDGAAFVNARRQTVPDLSQAVAPQELSSAGDVDPARETAATDAAPARPPAVEAPVVGSPPRPPTTSPVDMLKFIAKSGGLSFDGLSERSRKEGAKGHDLRNSGSVKAFVPGAGPLLRRKGLSLDEMGEKLWDAGYFGPPETTPRPTEAELIQTIDTLIRRKEKRYSSFGQAPAAKISGPTAVDLEIAEIGDRAARELDIREAWDHAAARLGLPPMFASEIEAVRESVGQGGETMPPLDADETDPDKIASYLIEAANVELEAVRQAAFDMVEDELYAGPETQPDGRDASEDQDLGTGFRGPTPDARNSEPSPQRREDGQGGPRPDGEAGGLDLGAATDPNIATKQRQETQLRADAPMRGENRTGQAQDGTMGMGLFDAADQPEIKFSAGDEPVTTLTGDELGEYADILDLQKKARQWFKDNLRLKSVTASDGASVRFTRTGEGKITGGERKLRAVPAIPSIIEKGDHQGPLPPSEKWKAKGAVAAHYYTAPVSIAGETANYGVLVQEFADGRRFYSLTDQPEGDVGSQLSLAEGRSETVARVEITPDAGINLFLLDEDFNTEPANAETGDVIARLQTRLAELNLSDKVRLATTNLIAGDRRIAGFYVDRLINVALDANQSAELTLDHEAVHALRDLGLFRDHEWSRLARDAKSDAKLMASIKRRYPGLDADGQIEEAIADRFMKWARGQRERGFIMRAFERVAEFFRAVGQAVRGEGFETSEQVMRAIEAGEVGERNSATLDTTGEPRFSIAEPLKDAGHRFDERDAALPEHTRALLASLPSPKLDAIRAKIDDWRIVVQDKMLPVRRTQEAVAQALGRDIAESENPYLAEELMTGKVGAQLEKLTEERIDPLFQAMHENDVSVDELETFLYARHAAERNAQIAKINPEFTPGEGSGMTDTQARAILNRVQKSGKRPTLDALASYVDKMLADALQTRVDAGLLGQEEAEAWRSTYQHYVPLRGRAEVDADVAPVAARVRSQSGMSVKGKESKRAFGRRSEADNILSYAILQAEEAIVRAEKNRVAQSFLRLAEASPNPEFWQVDKIERRPVMDQTSGLVRYELQSRLSAEDAPYTVTAKVNGDEHRVTMNRDNPAAVRVAEAMRSLEDPKFNKVMAAAATFNRYFSAINTRYNPSFVITNAVRDLQTMAVIGQQFDLPGFTRRVVRDYFGAMTARKNGDGDWSKWRREWELAGGKVYYNDSRDVNEVRKSLDSRAKLLKNPNGAARVWRTTFDYIEAANDSVERAIRLSVYKNARELGKSKAEAASMSRNVTVNFTRKGRIGPAMNSFYAFFNASTQGSANLILAAMKSKKVRVAMAGFIAAGFLTDMLNAMLSGDDEDGESFWDKMPEHEKSRNVVLMLPGGENGDAVKLPLAYGLNALFGLGRNASAMMRGAMTMGEAAMGSAVEFADAFNPVGSGGSWLNTLAPTLLDPAIDVTENTDFAGKPIQPEANPFEPEPTPSSNYFPSVSGWAKSLSQALNSATGGDEVLPGAASVSPEVLEYMAGFVTGGAGRFISDFSKIVTSPLDPEADLTIRDVPIAKALVTEKAGWVDKSRYYDRVHEVEQVLDRAKQYAEREDDEGLSRYLSDNTVIGRMEGATKEASKIMRKVRKERNEASFQHELGRIDDDVLRERLERVKEVEDRVISAYNARWNEVAASAAD